ncbi:MAG: glutathione S-transferase family protein, partial [Pseudomonadota bacterium]
LDLLEQEAPAAFWGGEAPDGSDIAVACLSDFVAHTGPQLEIARRCPGLAAHAARAATLAPFAGTRPG